MREHLLSSAVIMVIIYLDKFCPLVRLATQKPKEYGTMVYQHVYKVIKTFSTF